MIFHMNLVLQKGYISTTLNVTVRLSVFET
jgi:hypothetical protein